MILTWTPELIETALTILTDEQRYAIHLAAELTDTSRPSSVKVKKSGFGDVNHYLTTLAEARTKLQQWFAVWGIHGIGDLDFVEPGSSNEGRIQKAGMRRRK